MRRLGLVLLGDAIIALVGFTAYYGFAHDLDPGERRPTQVLYAAMLLLPPALFLTLAYALLIRRAPCTNVLGLVAIAALVGAPTLVFFLGHIWGVVVAVLLVAGLGGSTWYSRQRQLEA